MLEQLVHTESEAARPLRIHQDSQFGSVRTESRVSGDYLHGISITSGNEIGPTLRQILQYLCVFFRIDQCEGQRIGITRSGGSPPDSMSISFFPLAFSHFERLTRCLSYLHTRRSG